MKTLLFIAISLTLSSGIIAQEDPLVSGSSSKNSANLSSPGNQYPGGNEAMNQFLSDHLVYPKEAYDNGIEGKVYVQFILEKDGTLSNFMVTKSVNELLDEEALRLVKLMPKWDPYIADGKALRLKYMLPITFSLH